MISKVCERSLKACKDSLFRASREGDLLFRWVIWTLLIALFLGGKPWTFPANGKFWLESVRRLSPSQQRIGT